MASSSTLQVIVEEEKVADEDGEEEEEEADEKLSEEVTIDNDAHFANLCRKRERIVAQLKQCGGDDADEYLEHYLGMWDLMLVLRDECFTLRDEYGRLENTFAMNSEWRKAMQDVLVADEAQMGTLSGECDVSEKLIGKAVERIQIGHDMIESLRKEIANLNWDIECMNKMAQSELEENPQLAKKREALEREKSKLISEVSKLSDKLSNALAYQDELERRTSLTDIKINDISTQLEETEADVLKHQRAREKLDVELRDYKEQTAKTNEEIDALNEQLHVNNKALAKYGVQLQEHAMLTHKCTEKVDAWNERYAQLEGEYGRLNETSEMLRDQNVHAMRDLRAKDEDRVRLHLEYNRVIKERELCERRIRALEHENCNNVEEMMKLKDMAMNMARNVDGRKLDAAADKRVLANNVRERDALNRNLLRQQALGRDHTKVIRIQEQIRQRLDVAIDEHNREERRLNRQIFYLEKERDRLMEDALEKNNRLDEVTEDLAHQGQHTATIRATLAEHAVAFRACQSRFDSVRAERNQLQKAMQENIAESHEVREQLRINHRQSEQLKEQIASKEVTLNKAELFKRKILKERENIKIEYNNSVDTIRGLRDEINDRRTEERRLFKVLGKSVRLVQEQAAAITNLGNERDILGSQLVRRTDEIDLVQEKIRILQAMLSRGEAQYEERLCDIKLLKIEIKRLRLDRSLMERSVLNMNDLKVQVLHLERDLTKERMKTKALEDELHNPVNVQRWRKLEGKDANLEELLKKVGQLQRRLLAMTGTMIDVERELHDTQVVYMKLRMKVKLSTTIEVQKQMNRVHKRYLDNQLRNKAMISELNMLDVNNSKYVGNLEQLKGYLEQSKKSLKEIQAKHEEEKRQLRQLQGIAPVSSDDGTMAKEQKKDNDTDLDTLAISLTISTATAGNAAQSKSLL